jgi:hypothetical protein
MARSPGGSKASFAGVRSPPLRGVGYPSWDGLAGKTRGWRERRFSRRDALCASAWDGRTKAEAFHSQPMHRRTPGGLAGICPGGANTFPAGVRSPPLRGVGYPSSDGLAGQTRRWRERRCCRRDALCASAWDGRTKAEAFHSQPMHRRTPGGLAGICPGGANTFPAGVRSPPLRGGQRR